MKIGIIANGYPPSAYGGVEGYSYQIAVELKKRDNDVFVIYRESATNYQDYKVLKRIQDNVRVYGIVNDFKNIKRFENFYVNEFIDKIFEDILIQENPDILYFNHLIGLSVNLPNLAALHKIPFIFNVHDYWPICQRINLINNKSQVCYGPKQGGNCYNCLMGNTQSKNLRYQTLLLIKKVLSYSTRMKIRKFFKKAPAAFLLPETPNVLKNRYDMFKEALSKSRVILTPSAFVRKTLIENGYPDQKIRVFPLGIDIGNSNNNEQLSRPINFGFIGTIIPIKGVDLLIKAFSEISNEDIRLQIYGRMDIDKSYAEKIKRLVEKDHRIFIKGPFSVLERDKIYQSIDVIVVPSIWNETYSLVAREAMARGIPVIASDNGALGELIQPYKNGLLFSKGDVDGLRTALICLIEDNGLFIKIKNHIKSMTFLSIPQHVDLLQELFVSTID